jgi:Rrf2 family protein
MLSSKTKYALRAILLLAENAPEGIWLHTNDVAEREKVPRKFLEAIFVQLRDHGIIESRRGALGGHRLLRDPASVSIADVIRVLDGPLALTPCASRTRFRQCADCVNISECRLQPLMQQARDAVAGVLENCSLAKLASTQRSSKSRPPADKAAAARSAGSPESQARLPSSSWAKRKARVARIA